MYLFSLPFLFSLLESPQGLRASWPRGGAFAGSSEEGYPQKNKPGQLLLKESNTLHSSADTAEENTKVEDDAWTDRDRLSVLDGFHPRGFSKLPVDLETRAGASSAAGAACGAHFLPSKAWAQNASC